MDERRPGWSQPREYKINLAPELVDFLREIANRHHTTDTEVVQKIMKVGLTIIETMDHDQGMFL